MSKISIKKIFKYIISILITLIIYIALISKWMLSYPSFYIKYSCEWKHFSCEQNMSKECMKKELCVN